MKDSGQRVKRLASTLRNLEESLKIDDKRTRLLELEAKATDPNFWADNEAARKFMQELGALKDEIEEIEKLDKDIKTLFDLAKGEKDSNVLKPELEKVEKNLGKLRQTSFLLGAYDRKAAIISIHAGQGGTEAMDWVSMLYRMYLKFCEGRGWKTSELDASPGEEAGLKSVTFLVDGSLAYGYLKGEAGTHRLVRQSPFNADKLRQTSFALVEVLPELEDVDLPDIGLRDDDLEWQFFRASTQGGQNVQKVSSAVRVKHLPSELVVTSQQERTQEQNRKIALSLLRAKLWARQLAMKEKKVKELKGDYRPPSWGNQIRSYVLHPYKMVKDLRTKVEVSDADAVLDGELDLFIEAELNLASN
ncbi:MAG: peptide chain release factor 2 [Patescibacteria group bacterium]